MNQARTMHEEYGSLVSRCLARKRYPVLLDHVLLDVYYREMEPDETCPAVRRYGAGSGSPEAAFELENEADRMAFAVGETGALCVHEVEGPGRRRDTRCRTVRLDRSVVAAELRRELGSLEHELYAFLAHLNADVTRVRRLLDLPFDRSTRFLPQHVRLWATRHTTKALPLCVVADPARFGPDGGGGLEPRNVWGGLSACASRRDVLSLRDHVGWEVPEPFADVYDRYNMHYSDRWKTVFPLAYNPLENPIIQA